MDTVFPSPVATTFEAFSAIISAAVYLVVGIAALARAPGDVRTRVFFGIALASAAPYSVTLLLWAHGSDAAFTVPVIAAVALSLMFGSLTLLHFSLVFPWRRPWIRTHGHWLYAGYLIAPVAVAVSAWTFRGLAYTTGSGGIGAVAPGMTEGLVLLLVVIPVLFVLGLAAPFGAVLSLYKTWLEAKASCADAARVSTFWVLISQMAGGVLTILIIPLVHLVATTGPWATMAAVLLFAFGLLMPLAFAASVWKYRILDLDADAGPPPNRTP